MSVCGVTVSGTTIANCLGNNLVDMREVLMVRVVYAIPVGNGDVIWVMDAIMIRI